MKAYGCGRVSTERQASDGMGAEEQVFAIQEFCDRNDLELQAIEIDRCSGTVPWDQREGLSRLLTDMGPGSVLVIPYWERVARDLIGQEVFVRMLDAQGIALRSCNPSEDTFLVGETDDPTRVLVRQVLGAVAQYQRTLVYGRMVRARRLIARDGGWIGGTPPFGFTTVPGERYRVLVPDPNEHGSLLLILSLQREGMSLRLIADELNKRGIEPRSGGVWSRFQVRNALDGARKYGDSLDLSYMGAVNA